MNNDYDNWLSVRNRIDLACQKAGRKSTEITLCAVSKKVSYDRIAALHDQGQICFGENYVQEAIAKVTDSPEEICWHFIGHLQTNKVKQVVGNFDLIQTVDSVRLLSEIEKRSEQMNIEQPILIEYQLDNSGAKSGVTDSEFYDLLEQCVASKFVQLKGLMAMPPFGIPEAQTTQLFRKMKGLFDALPPENRIILSMGMSGDFELAIQEGATLIRVGTSIFGDRNQMI